MSLHANTTGSANIAMGSGAMYKNTDRSNIVAIGDSSLFSNGVGASAASDATGNTAVGSKAMFSNTIGQSNTSMGYNSLWSNTSGNYNTALGKNTLYLNQTGNQNTAIGYDALSKSTSDKNTAVGYQSLQNLTGNGNNTALGWYTLNTNTGGENTAIGTGALSANTTGSNNVALGYNAGTTTTSANSNTTGSDNVFIGSNAGPGVPSASSLQNAIAIGKNAQVNASNSMALGGTGADAVNVGIGTASPGAKLEVIGDVKIVDGNQGSGKVLTSDANGLASWQGAASRDIVQLTYDLPSGTDGGTTVAGAWTTRALNTELADLNNIATLASNQFTLPAGTYIIQFDQIFTSHVNVQMQFRSRIRNVTDGATVALGLTSRLHIQSGESGNINNPGTGVFTITSPKTFEIQHSYTKSRTINTLLYEIHLPFFIYFHY